MGLYAGGVIFLYLRRDVEEQTLHNLVWFLDALRNPGSQGMKNSWDVEIPDGAIEGGYGTDCEFTIEDLPDLLKILSKPDPCVTDGHYGDTLLRDLTLAELVESVITDPLFTDNWHQQLRQPVGDPLLQGAPWWGCHPLNLLVWGIMAGIPTHLENMLVGDWACQVGALIGRTNRVETWTQKSI